MYNWSFGAPDEAGSTNQHLVGGDRIPPSRSSQRRPYQYTPGFRINGQIRVPQVRLIMPDGSNRGIVDIQEAQSLARQMNLDLIEVASTANPPVCRIFDFGKFNFEREKKEREAKKAQKIIDVKGIRLRPKTTDHHLSFKVRAARRFLEAGNKVKVTLRFKGREDRIPHVALRMMDKVRTECEDLSLVETSPSMEGKTMLMVLAPTQGTLLAAHNKNTQDRLERERAEDVAKGYAEEEETETENDDEAFEEDDDTAPKEAQLPPELRAQALLETGVQRATIDFQDKEARRKMNKDKRDIQRQLEQFDVP